MFMFFLQSCKIIKYFTSYSNIRHQKKLYHFSTLFITTFPNFLQDRTKGGNAVHDVKVKKNISLSFVKITMERSLGSIKVKVKGKKI